jgi:hypothetical protein
VLEKIQGKKARHSAPKEATPYKVKVYKKGPLIKKCDC